jgi:hypothetical protein
MQFSKYKSSRQYKFLDPVTVTLAGGYRLCRATRPLYLPGRLYWEFDYRSSAREGHVRLGIATIRADMEAPVGVDAEGYSVRDLGGAFHCARRAVDTPDFHEGSTIGFGFDGNSLRLFINGEDRGCVFSGIDATKTWYPAVSIYRDAEIVGRFLPPFKFEPGPEWTPAGDVPNVETEKLFSSKDIVKWMKGTLDAGDYNAEAWFAIHVALIPAHQMVI